MSVKKNEKGNLVSELFTRRLAAVGAVHEILIERLHDGCPAETVRDLLLLYEDELHAAAVAFRDEFMIVVDNPMKKKSSDSSTMAVTKDEYDRISC